jgi:predicted alpha/beta-fold hydrolase
MSDHTFRPAWWVPGPHAQTMYGKFFRRVPPLPTRRERWDTPDGDFVQLERLAAPPDAPPGAPRLVVLHGLEGAPRSHYVQGLFAESRRRGWAMDLLIFRSCAGEPNRARRLYHSGETEDIDLVVRRIRRDHPQAPLAAVGVSLGGNVLLKWLGEQGSAALPVLAAAAAVSVPYDLARGSRHIERGFSRVYARNFLRSLKRKAAAKRTHFPDLYDPDALARARTLWDFDHHVTAPVHGFASAADYYHRSSAIHFLPRVRVPTLLLSAADDPFLPRAVLDEVRAVAAANPALTVQFVEHGGHVGFVGGRLPWRPSFWAEARVIDHVSRHSGATALESR